MHTFIKQLAICFSCVTLLTGCITIEETYSLKKDGSGSYAFKVNMSEMMTMMKAMGGLDKMNEEGSNPADDIKLDEGIEQLKKINGITNVQNIQDKETGIFAISFDFANLEALQQAKASSSEEGEAVSSLTLTGKKLTLKHVLPASLTNNEMLSGDSTSNQELTQGLMSQIKYNIYFTIEGGAKSIITDAQSDFNTSNKETFQLTGTLQDLSDTPDLMNAVIELN